MLRRSPFLLARLISTMSSTPIEDAIRLKVIPPPSLPPPNPPSPPALNSSSPDHRRAPTHRPRNPQRLEPARAPRRDAELRIIITTIQRDAFPRAHRVRGLRGQDAARAAPHGVCAAEGGAGEEGRDSCAAAEDEDAGGGGEVECEGGGGGGGVRTGMGIWGWERYYEGRGELGGKEG